MEDQERNDTTKNCLTCKYKSYWQSKFPCSNCYRLFNFPKKYYPNDKDYYEKKEE